MYVCKEKDCRITVIKFSQQENSLNPQNKLNMFVCKRTQNNLVISNFLKVSGKSLTFYLLKLYTQSIFTVHIRNIKTTVRKGKFITTRYC